jgi:dihydroflavonol-4-reductase
MENIDTSAPVMITGATGYVAGWIIKAVLEAGVTVHAPVRDPDNAEKVKHLQDMSDSAPGAIRFFKADLLEEGSYREAMAGCSVVFHTASPFTTVVKDPQKELVDPAQLGTRNVLEEANRVASVRRVVLTSSCAAIYGDNVDVAKAPNGILTEEVWNTSSSLTHNAYSYSKTVAEREAWKIAEAQDRWDLVVINPSLVIGPGTKPFGTSESFNLVRQYGDGSLKSGAPRWGMGAVDVRDLAKAHVAAAFTPEAHGRNIISGHNSDLLEMGQCLLERFGDEYPIPRKAMPKWLVWLIGPMVNKAMTRQAISDNVDVPWRADNSKGVRELGVTYRPLQESMEEMFQQMVDAGYFEKS